MLKLLRWNLKVTGLPAVREDGLGLTVGQGAADLVFGNLMTVFCDQKQKQLEVVV